MACKLLVWLGRNSTQKCSIQPSQQERSFKAINQNKAIESKSNNTTTKKILWPVAAPRLSGSAFVALSFHWHPPRNHVAEPWALYKASGKCSGQEDFVLWGSREHSVTMPSRALYQMHCFISTQQCNDILVCRKAYFCSRLLLSLLGKVDSVWHRSWRNSWR